MRGLFFRDFKHVLSHIRGHLSLYLYLNTGIPVLLSIIILYVKRDLNQAINILVLLTYYWLSLTGANFKKEKKWGFTSNLLALPLTLSDIIKSRTIVLFIIAFGQVIGNFMIFTIVSFITNGSFDLIIPLPGLFAGIIFLVAGVTVSLSAWLNNKVARVLSAINGVVSMVFPFLIFAFGENLIEYYFILLFFWICNAIINLYYARNKENLLEDA